MIGLYTVGPGEPGARSLAIHTELYWMPPTVRSAGAVLKINVNWPPDRITPVPPRSLMRLIDPAKTPGPSYIKVSCAVAVPLMVDWTWNSVVVGNVANVPVNVLLMPLISPPPAGGAPAGGTVTTL